MILKSGEYSIENTVSFVGITAPTLYNMPSSYIAAPVDVMINPYFTVVYIVLRVPSGVSDRPAIIFVFVGRLVLNIQKLHNFVELTYVSQFVASWAALVLARVFTDPPTFPVGFKSPVTERIILLPPSVIYAVPRLSNIILIGFFNTDGSAAVVVGGNVVGTGGRDRTSPGVNTPASHTASVKESIVCTPHAVFAILLGLLIISNWLLPLLMKRYAYTISPLRRVIAF